jgi:Zn-dependent metalloprotease
MAAISIFSIVSKKTDATSPLFGIGKSDEREVAKAISLGILRDRAAQRAIGDVAEYKVRDVVIDELKMAHTKFQQVIGGVPVWEGEAIVHLKSDGSLSLITDSLKEGIAVDTTPHKSGAAADD